MPTALLAADHFQPIHRTSSSESSEHLQCAFYGKNVEMIDAIELEKSPNLLCSVAVRSQQHHHQQQQQHQMSSMNVHGSVSVYVSSHSSNSSGSSISDGSIVCDQNCVPYYSCVIERSKLNVNDDDDDDGNGMRIEMKQSHNQLNLSNDMASRTSAEEQPIEHHADTRPTHDACTEPTPLKLNESNGGTTNPNGKTNKMNCEKCGHKLRLQRLFTDTFQ